MQAAIEFEPSPDQEPGDLRENAERWMAENAEVVALFEQFAVELMKAGQQFGIKALFERVRWEVAIIQRGTFKLNNNHAPYVARELLRRQPLLANHLRFRRTKYENGAA